MRTSSSPALSALRFLSPDAGQFLAWCPATPQRRQRLLPRASARDFAEPRCGGFICLLLGGVPFPLLLLPSIFHLCHHLEEEVVGPWPSPILGWSSSDWDGSWRRCSWQRHRRTRPRWRHCRWGWCHSPRHSSTPRHHPTPRHLQPHSHPTPGRPRHQAMLHHPLPGRHWSCRRLNLCSIVMKLRPPCCPGQWWSSSPWWPCPGWDSSHLVVSGSAVVDPSSVQTVGETTMLESSRAVRSYAPSSDGALCGGTRPDTPARSGCSSATSSRSSSQSLMGARSWRRTWRQRPGARRLLHRPQALLDLRPSGLPHNPKLALGEGSPGWTRSHLHLIDIAPAAIFSVVALLAVELRHIAVGFACVGICSSTARGGPSASCHGCKQVVAPECPIMPGLPAPLPTTSVPSQHTKFGGNGYGEPFRDWRRSSFWLWMRRCAHENVPPLWAIRQGHPPWFHAMPQCTALHLTLDI